MVQWLTKATRSRHFQYGVPFFCFIFGGAYALKQFRSVRYDSDLNPKANKFVKPEEFEKALQEKRIKDKGLMHSISEKEISLEQEYEKLKEVDIDNWENKRGPRPKSWGESQ
jgi:cytochrome c oxidase assembly protein subunit 16